MGQENTDVPVTILTGFLGSGKTTLLNALLRLPSLADTAVIVNEFGEIGLDHLLIEQAIEDAVLLKNGCICCTVRGDIADTLHELFRKRASGELPWFSRIAIETTGLADPAPVAQSLGEGCRLDGIVATADALHLPAQLAAHDTARHQIAFADRIVLTKTDLASAAQIAEAEALLRRLNPRAVLRHSGEVTREDVFGLGPCAQPRAWLGLAAPAQPHGEIASVLLRQEGAIDWDDVRRWLESVLSLRGAQILRIKGILRLRGEAAPMVLQTVHHQVHNLQALPEAGQRAWDGEGSFLVVIGRDLTEIGLRASFAAATQPGSLNPPDGSAGR
jgi:G3E family GTPase